jgi:ParD-like antitoxin of type II bacterial toxin-antitoxin system
MATTSPARIDDDLYASAKLAGEVQSRSASQQVVHWARIGREIEASAGISPRDIAEVLAGARSYDRLGAKEQAVVRAAWSARMDTIRASLNLAEEFSAAGRTWVELDEDGVVVERRAATTGGATGGRAKAERRPARTSGNATGRRKGTNPSRSGAAVTATARTRKVGAKTTATVGKDKPPGRRAKSRSGG